MPEAADKTFKAAEVCKSTDVAPYVLKYWLTEFPCLSAADKDKSLNRSYSAKEVQIVSRIRQLLYDEGFTIAGAKKKIDAEIAAGEFDGKSAARKKPAPAPAPVKPISLPVSPAPAESRQVVSPLPAPASAPRAADTPPASPTPAVPAKAAAPAVDPKRLAKELKDILKLLPHR